MSATATAVRSDAWTSHRWCVFFHDNARSLLDIPWEDGARLGVDERAALVESLQDFQLGESSEGLNLMRAAREHAEASGDPDYVEAMRLFIAEEQRHARELGRYLDLAGVPRLTRSGTDSVFRGLRRLAGIELFVTVLVTAEMIGQVYYQAVYKATSCPVLRRICAQLLRDEARHVRFHSDRLRFMRCGRAAWLVHLLEELHRLFLTGTSWVVWRKHGKAFRAGGLDFAAFRKAVAERFVAAVRRTEGA